MTLRSIASLTLSTLLLGGLTAGCTMGGNGGINTASAQVARDPGYARRAARALAKHDPAAVVFAEAAVQAAPLRADYRLLLAQSYLAAGRFVAAREAFGDVLRLDPANGRAALNLALTQLACDDWLGARETLKAHADRIAPADLGLAVALTGDPAQGVALLMAAARQPDVTARVRQNLALSLALAGQWQMSRAVAAVDVSPADLDARMQAWVAFTQPRGVADQVAALLGVQPAADQGQPVALALVRPGSSPGPSDPAPVTAVAVVQDVPPPASRVVFGPRHEVVQILPPIDIASVRKPVKLAARRKPVRVAFAGRY